MNGQECVYMTVSEVKRYLNISQAAAYELTHRADFPVCRIRRQHPDFPNRPFWPGLELRTHIPEALARHMASA